MPDLSIIIPIYNTPNDLLLRCFQSLDTICDIDYEAILVDDGSQQDTGAFCAEYVKKHSNFYYFRKENGGVSSARNAGLEQAKGRYVAFLDSDDALLGQCFTKDLLIGDPDLVIFDILLCSGKAQVNWHALDTPQGDVAIPILLRQLVVSKSMNSPCAKLFSLNLIRKHDLHFDTSFITGEDWLFVCNYVSHIQNARYQQQNAQIYYRDGATSLSRLTRFPDRMMENLQTIYKTQLSLCDMDWATTTRDLLKSTAATQWLEHLFNLSADLKLLHKLTAHRKEAIRQAATEAITLLTPSAPKKARIKANILLHFPVIIDPIARLRRLYLKIKR